MGELVDPVDDVDDEMGPFIQRLFDARDDGLPYLTHQQETVTRAELRERVAKQAAVFAGYGIGPGSTVGLRTPPSFTQVEVLLALWRLGAQVMLFDFRLKPAEVEALCATCRPQFMVSAGANVRATFGFRPDYEVVTECHGTGRAATTGHRLVQFSSGSTGRPKVIGRTARSLAAEVERFAAIPGMPGEGDRLLLLSSTAHSFGLIAGLLHSLAAGVSVVFAPRVSARDILRTAVDHRITALFGVPMHYELLAAAIDPPATARATGRGVGRRADASGGRGSVRRTVRRARRRVLRDHGDRSGRHGRRRCVAAFGRAGRAGGGGAGAQRRAGCRP